MTSQAELHHPQPAEAPSPHTVRIYGTEALRRDERGEATGLVITFNNREFLLSIVNVGTPDSPVHIAWLDTNHHVNPILAEEAASELAATIVRFDAAVVVTPNSSKSAWMVDRATQRASETLSRHIALVTLLGATERQNLIHQDLISFVSYRNVTSPDRDKFMGITTDDVEILNTFKRSKRNILIVDDVYTTGGTINAAQRLLHDSLLLPEENTLPVAVLAAESHFGPDYPVTPPSFVHPLIHIPEFVGNIPAHVS
jgi:uracil phosphoribosyltransferase